MVNFWFPMCQCQRWVKKDKLLTQISAQKRIKFLKRFGMSVSYVLLKLPLIKMSQYSLYSSASFLIRKIAGHSWIEPLSYCGSLIWCHTSYHLCASCEVPDQPGVHSPEEQVSLLMALLHLEEWCELIHCEPCNELSFLYVETK